MKADWHQKREVLAKCPNCGDDVAPGIAFHKSSVGILCVIDPEKAFKAGAIDRARMEDLIPRRRSLQRGPLAVVAVLSPRLRPLVAPG